MRLLLVHGTLSHYRLARLIKYSFYKNIAFNMILFWFQFFCGYSGAHLPKHILITPCTMHDINGLLWLSQTLLLNVPSCP